jgi:2,3-bisphosphoglycerate-independent phosphoglycerate mutase
LFNFSIGKKKKPYVLIILDGWGVAPVWGGNAISLSEVNNFMSIQKNFPYTTLRASDGDVGLPAGSPGNSEAGHLNIGAGHIVYQDQPIIDREIENGNFFTNQVLLDAVKHAQTNKSNIHVFGLLSKTGTHSHINHLFALLELIKKSDYKNVYIHLFTDGRDSDSMSGIEMLSEVESAITRIGLGTVESIIGRFFAMDRDNRWDRVEKTYDLLTQGKGKPFASTGAIFTDSYAHGVTDEFVEPSTIQSKTQHFIPISDNDAVIFFNFRSDRAKELTRTFLDPNLPELPNRHKLNNLYFATFVMHDGDKYAKHAFSPEKVVNPIAEIWSNNKLRQYHTAETEKYAHVTYFINGGREAPFPGEDRLMIPSPTECKTYDKMPEMNAAEVTATLLEAINKNIYDGLIVNYANTDMVGHTGNLKAAIKAVEYVDKCLGQVLKAVMNQKGVAFVFADHGNVEQMVNPKTGTPDTEHTCNPVPFIIVTDDSKLKAAKLRRDGNLAAIAPTVMDIMGLTYDKTQKEKSLITADNG